MNYWAYCLVLIQRTARTVYSLCVLSLSGEDAFDLKMTWLVGAIVSISSEDTVLSYVQDFDIPDEIVNRIRLFAGYFRREMLEGDQLQRLIKDDNPLALRWTSFPRGRWQESLLQGRVRELNSHPDPEVAEFSIWSVSQSGDGFRESSIDPDRLTIQAASVRRWSYYLIASDMNARIAYSDLIVDRAQAEPDERAREGLARGLVASKLLGEWMHFADEWAQAESSERIRRVLQRGFTGQAFELARGSSSVWRSALAGPFAIKGGQTVAGKKSTIENVKREMLYVWAVDTVAYSQMDDDAQLSVVKALLAEIGDQEPLASLNSSDLVYLFTGDGMIVVVRGATRPRDIFTAASDFLRRCKKVYGFSVRMGINSGSGLVLQLSDSSVQVIGNTVNNAVRVMSSTEQNGFAVSGTYYDDAFQGGRVSIPGVRFTSRNAADKHGNTLRVYDVIEGELAPSEQTASWLTVGRSALSVEQRGASQPCLPDAPGQRPARVRRDGMPVQQPGRVHDVALIGVERH